MLARLRAVGSLYRHFGPGWLLFRLGYAFRMRTGILRWQMPSYDWDDRPLASWLKAGIPSEPDAYAEWREQNTPAFLFQRLETVPPDVPWNPELAVEEAERILTGEFKYFEHTFLKTGFPPDWTLDPVSGIRLDPDKHWSQISDYGGYDIKFVWEASRFSSVYILVRAYAYRPDERYAEAFWSLIEDWARNNPPGRGPNWKDGQEAALRLMAWSFGLYGFRRSPRTTPQRAGQLTTMIAALAKRILQNIGYAISTRSNHAISEGLGLWVTGCLFPELKEAEGYLSVGRELLEREAAAQIFKDGSYSMYSLNYQRFILQLYFFAIRLGELNQARFSESLYQAVGASVNYLSLLIEPETGEMPAYGSNDGSLALPLNTCDFTDYRPVLQAGYYLIHGKRLFEAGPWDEDLFWLYGPQALHSPAGEIARYPFRSFEDGGMHILRSRHSQAVIRCTVYRERPSHADQLHVDLWWRGKNIACDAGTYLYNGAGIWLNGLARTAAHNSVTVDFEDQMIRLSRFTWANWAEGRTISNASFSGILGWQGAHDGYQRLTDPVRHARSVIMLDDERWLVVDHLHAARSHHYALHWLINDFPHSENHEQNSICLWPASDRYQIRLGLMAGTARFSVVQGSPDSIRGWRSRYYAEKQPAISTMLETDQAQACFWTFFGFEGDVVEYRGGSLFIRTPEWRASVDLPGLDSANGLSPAMLEKKPASSE